MKNNYVTKVRLLVFMFFCSVLSWGQFNIASVSTNYTQDFNTLTSGTWTDNTTLTGWYARTDATASIASYAANTGSTLTAGLYAFGVAGTNALTDRGLGYAPTNAYTGASGTGKGYVGWRLKNTTGAAITSITVTWSGEQWRRDNATAQILSLFYQNAATVTSLTGGTWTAAPSTFTSPQLSTTALVLDGNTPANRTANISVVITVNIPAGEEIMLRWEDLNDSGNDHFMAIDDVTINASASCSSAAITAQPSTTVQNLCQSAAATALSVAATGTTLTYQWYSNTTATNSGGTPVGTSSASYTPVTTTAGTLYYYCVATAACGTSVTSNVSGAVNVTAIPSAPAGTINISANPSCGAATLTYSAPNTNIYWQTTSGGTSTANPTTSPFTSLATAGSYTRYVRELNGSCWSPEISITFTVVAPINITAQPPNRVIVDGGNTTFTVTATGSTPTYQWQVDTTGTGTSFVNLANVLPYSTVTTATLTITGVTLAMNGYLYRCIVSGSAPCGSVTSNSGLLSVTNTTPNNPTNASACYGNTSVALSWTAATGSPDGYMVFALQGATTPTATAGTMNDAGTYTANTDFSLASIATPASMGKCVYKGAGISTVITGLTNATNYSFTIVAYRGNTLTGWSPGTFTTIGTWRITNTTIDVPEVSALAASVASGQSALTWTRPTPLSCYDEYLVVANQGTVVFTPSGDGTAYIPNSVYVTSNQVVYKGTGAGVTVTGLTNGLSYCYKVFVRKGTEWSNGVEVCQIPNLVYCASGATSAGDSEIENVTLVGYSTSIANNTANACTTGVNNYTAQSANVQVGGTYTVTVEFGDCDGGTQYNGAGGVWIDWNNDGDFLDANETIGTALVAVSGGNVIQNFTINVPLGQPIGNYRMRIVQTESATLATINPCGTFAFGSTEDYTVQVVSACVPTHSVTSFTPTSGPVGTEVTINGTGLTGATVTFSGVNATIVSNTGTQIVAIVPATATTGLMSVKDSQPCAVDNAFTVISNVNTSCEGAAATTDLIIYDIHDEQTGSGGFITLYNGTAATVDLINYTLWRTTDHDNGAEIDYANLTGTIAPGALGILKVSVGSCGPASTNGTIDGGFNENDGIQLRNAAGTVIVDDVDTYPTAPGYYMVRNAGALNARTSYVAADWNTIPLAAGVCYPSAGLTLPTGTAASPVVTSHPTYSPSCGSTSAVLNTAGTEGFAGGLTLTYQWYFAAPGSTTWTALTDGGIYSGATTASLNISNVTGVVNYQYYCQIRENSATCYSASNAVKVTDTNGTTWNGTTWSNGLPSLTKAAIIDGTYVTTTNGNFSCCSLIVNATRTLTISSGGYVEVQNDITTNGILDVLNNGSLVQISDTGVNTGNIRYNRTANVRRQDYVYWSTPVAGFANSAVSPGTNLGYQYKWLPTTAGINNFGNWTLANETMVLGKGYCLRAPDAFSLTTLANYTATFTGVPNNGVVTIPISRGTWNGGTYATGVSSTLGTNEDDNWNLVGNPYPSAIHAINFLTLNPNIDGFVNIWTHGTLPSSSITDPFYNDYAYNYTSADYITYNAAGASSGPGVFNGRIGGGQGFFVSMLHTTGATTENLIFNNSLRNVSYNNGQFFRSATATTSPDDAEKHRIWFDLVTPTGTSFRSLLAYAEGATNGKDRLFDAFSNEKLSFHIFSLVENEKMLIQGRTLPFDDTDKVNIGVTLPQDGLYKIALAAVDGLFANPSQNIYLEDKLLNVIYDLRSAPYSFMGNKGTIKDRFIIRYKNSEVLANDSFTTNNDVVVISNQELSVTSTKEKIANIIVFDVLGRKLYESKEVNANYFALPVQKRDAPLFIEIVLEDGTKVNKKTVY